MTAAPSKPVETEIKFLLPDGEAVVLHEHPALRGSEVQPPSQERTTYFDTADHTFARSGASFRLRHAGGQCVQTLKLRDGSTLFGRGEWEWLVKDGQPEPKRLAETPLAGFKGELRPVFSAEVVRSLRSIHSGDARIEIAIDEGTIRAGDRAEPIREVELELKEGKPAALYRLAEVLHTDLALILGTESKSDRGWRLLTGEPRRGEKSPEVDLPRDIVAAEAFRWTVASLVAALLAHQPAAAAGAMEGVHGMRIAARRLRALLGLFRPCLAAEPETRFTAALRDLARVLGEARDWDVFVSQTLPKTGDPQAERLRPLAEAERRAAHRRVAEEFGRPALTRTTLGLAAWAEDAEALSGEAGGGMEEPLVDLAPELVERLVRKAKRRGRHIRRRSEEELHDLRKALKKLRYGVELVSSLYKEKRVSAYLHRCKLLQEKLGGLNDAAVAVTLAERLAQQDTGLAPAAMSVKVWADAQRAEAHHDLRKAWRAFRDAPLPYPSR